MRLRSLLIILSLTSTLSCQQATSIDNGTAIESASQKETEEELQTVQSETNRQNNNELLAQHRDIPQKSPLEPTNLSGLPRMSECELWRFLQAADFIDSSDLTKLLADSSK